MGHALSIVDGRVSADDRRRLIGQVGEEAAAAIIAEEEAPYRTEPEPQPETKKPRRAAEPSPNENEE